LVRHSHSCTRYPRESDATPRSPTGRSGSRSAEAGLCFPTRQCRILPLNRGAGKSEFSPTEPSRRSISMERPVAAGAIRSVIPCPESAASHCPPTWPGQPIPYRVQSQGDDHHSSGRMSWLCRHKPRADSLNRTPHPTPSHYSPCSPSQHSIIGLLGPRRPSKYIIRKMAADITEGLPKRSVGRSARPAGHRGGSGKGCARQCRAV